MPRAALLLLIPLLAGAAEVVPPASTLPAATTPAPAPSVAEAGRLVAEGKRLMQESNNEPSQSVGAAVAFSTALPYYEQAGESDTISELEADIFWCKKRMTLDDIKRFRAAKDGSATDAAALDRAEEVATRRVDAIAADAYFARAQRFATDHPTDQLAVAVRWFEVAQRFPGTPVGVKAQEQSLAAQGKAMQAQAAAAQADQAKRRTLFARPATPSSAAVAPPAAADQRAATAQVRKLFKEQFARTRPAQKRRLAARLLKEAKQTVDDAALRWALLGESLQLAADGGELATLLAAADARATQFTGVDAKAVKKEWLAKLHAPVATAALKLLANPDDVDANSTVGKWFAQDARRWDEAVPMLAHGGDAVWRKPAEMELAVPAGPGQRLELADGWYDLGAKAKDPAKEALWEHALTWYREAVPGLTGISATRVATRITEIEDFLPLVDVDWNALTARQWERLRAPAKTVSVQSDHVPAGVTLTAGQKVRVVPHPTDTWSLSGFGIDATVGWKGYTLAGKQGDHLIGALVVYVGNATFEPGVIEGTGAMSFGHITLPSSRPRPGRSG
jgi:hypothetical protein